MLLVIDDQGNIDCTKLADEIDILISSKPIGIYSNGTAGELYTQTKEEFGEISQLLAEKCEAPEVPFQIGVSHISAQISLEQLRRTIVLHFCLSGHPARLVSGYPGREYPVSSENVGRGRRDWAHPLQSSPCEDQNQIRTVAHFKKNFGSGVFKGFRSRWKPQLVKKSARE